MLRKVVNAIAVLVALGGAAHSLPLMAQPCTPRPGAGLLPLRSINSTHRLPSFSYINGLSLYGNTMLDVTIAPNGTVRAVTVIRPSGSLRADNDFAAYVKKHWRWAPPFSLETCQPAEAHTKVSVDFFANSTPSFGTDAVKK